MMMTDRRIPSGTWVSLLAAAVLPLCFFSCSRSAGSPGHTNGSESSLIPVAGSPSSDSASDKDSAMTEKFQLSEEEWKERLTPEQYYVLRQKGTERPFVNEFDEHFEPGTYSCAACGAELFESETKFNSGCGWPAFYAAKAGDRVNFHVDRSHGMVRTEVTCARCDSHLGHVFDDAPQTPTGQRYCINSVSLTFRPKTTEP
jgi:methionine-R-sulfoxide reductase